MFSKIRLRFFRSLLTAVLLCMSVLTESVAAPVPEPQATSASKKKRSASGGTSKSNRGGATSSKAKKGTGAKGTNNAKGSKNAAKGKGSGTQAKGKGNSKGAKGKGTSANKKGSSKPETSADVKKRQEETRREIQRTQEELKRNEAEMKKSLGDLGRINADLEKTRGEVTTLQTAVGKLDNQITTLSGQIADNEKKLEQLRAEYLKAVKKMRTARGHSSTLAFIFSSDNFNQAMRRMRYLRQFSAWKDKQSAEINKKVALLTEQKKKLGIAKQQKDFALKQQKVAEAELAKKGREQDAVVADLKRNGDLLSVHLSKKQQEANALKNRIAALIAEEERKAAAEREAARKREEERREAERLAAVRAAEERAAAEREAAEKAREQELAQANAKSEEKTAQAPKSEPKKEVKPESKKETKKAETKKSESKKESGKNYADARKRKPRGQADAGEPKPSSGAAKGTAPAKTTVEAPLKAVDGGFAAMKGSLPRPVDGLWRVTSRFGRQELPDLPGVVYDNPGINVEVSIGAAVKAIYSGKVSGVYMVPGYQTVIIVNHGNYYTAYGNLKGPSVKVGDSVKAGQKLGSAAENQDDPGHGELHFEVYRNREKLNPLNWIR